nr:uncharacterized protein LOC109149028 [Ipomoea trifida]
MGMRLGLHVERLRIVHLMDMRLCLVSLTMAPRDQNWGEGMRIQTGTADKIVWAPTQNTFTFKTAKDLDCLHWCKRRMITRVVFESNEWSGYRNMELEEYTMNVGRVQCADRVNAVAQCLVNWGPGLNVVYWKKEGLPRGLGRILALEGIPHFVFGPGVDGF